MAVLPFANLSGEPSQEYFSDGITQEMITELGRLHPAGLSVIGRTSVQRYKNGDTPIDRIGRELNVEYVLEGSTQREADNVRINAKLISVKDQTQLWGDSYDRHLSGILALQSEVSRRVAEALTLKLLRGERVRLSNKRKVDPEAHDAYLKGIFHWDKLTGKELDIAHDYFRLGLEKDPTYAPLHTGLALVWAARQQMGYIPMLEAGPKAKQAALKAISLDPDSPEAVSTLAMVKSWIDWDWKGAANDWKRALELNPNDATTQVYYGHYLAIMAQVDQALLHGKRASELDPFNSLIHGLYAAILNFDPRRYGEAAEAARKALSLQPDNPIGRSQLQKALLWLGEYDKVLAMQQERHSSRPELLAALEAGTTSGGFREAQRRLAEIFAERCRQTGAIGAQGVGELFFDAGDRERALNWFEKACENHSGNLPYITRPYYYDVLKSSPRYRMLLKKMGLPVDRSLAHN